MRETKVEEYLRQKSEKLGFLCYKFISPTHNGVPDRILIGHGKTIFVETKAPGEKPRKLQETKHRIFREHGAEVYVLDTIEKINIFFDKNL